jgi:phosphotransferase system enzyme I (PtsI)
MNYREVRILSIGKFIYGYLHFVEAMEQNVAPSNRKNSASELYAFENAVKQVKTDIIETKKLISPSLHVLWTILEFYELAIEDFVMIETIRESITRTHLTAESAINLYFDHYIDSLKTKDAYFQSRTNDFMDLKNRLLNALSHQNKLISIGKSTFKKPTILVFNRIFPFELSQIELTNIEGVISTEGSLHSHVAIILSSLNIPYLIIPSAKSDLVNHDFVQIDLMTSKITKTHPIPQIQAIETHLEPINHAILSHVSIHPAINFENEIPIIIPDQWKSIGLYRTEFFFMDKNYLPDEIEQYLHYRKICQKALGLRVRFRLLDVEPDKPIRMLEGKGYGVDLLIKNHTLLATQLRALLALSKDFPIGITVPMINALAEIDQIKTVIHEILNEDEFQSSHLDYQFGIMIERKNALKQFNSLSGFDYILIGTNDLSAEYGKIERSNQLMNQNTYLNKELQTDLINLIKITEQKNILTLLCGDGANLIDVIKENYILGFRNFAPSPKNINLYQITSNE